MVLGKGSVDPKLSEIPIIRLFNHRSQNSMITFDLFLKVEASGVGVEAEIGKFEKYHQHHSWVFPEITLILIWIKNLCEFRIFIWIQNQYMNLESLNGTRIQIFLFLFYSYLRPKLNGCCGKQNPKKNTKIED